MTHCDSVWFNSRCRWHIVTMLGPTQGVDGTLWQYLFQYKRWTWHISSVLNDSQFGWHVARALALKHSLLERIHCFVAGHIWSNFNIVLFHIDSSGAGRQLDTRQVVIRMIILYETALGLWCQWIPGVAGTIWVQLMGRISSYRHSQMAESCCTMKGGLSGFWIFVSAICGWSWCCTSHWQFCACDTGPLGVCLARCPPLVNFVLTYNT